VNGRVATLGEGVEPGEDRVLLDGRPVEPPHEHAYLALNKPRGYLTAMSDPHGRPTVADLMPGGVPGLVPVGRLDADTTGLLLLTNDGDLAHRVAHPSSGIEKEYRLTLRGTPTDDQLSALASGPNLEDGKMLPPKLSKLRKTPRATTLHLTIHEGRNRIIRRACAAAGLVVISLKRLRIGPVTLGDLPEGCIRELTQEEIATLRDHGR
jgi:23S rRNA pseudouridine2605 synthase